MMKHNTYKEPYGYPVSNGYLGWVGRMRSFMLFETEVAYLEYIRR